MKGLGLSPDQVIEFAISHAPPREVSALVRSLRTCPKDPVRLSEILAKSGLYEEVVYLAKVLGCPVSTEAVKAAWAGLLALGEPKWESEAAGLLGQRPLLSGNSTYVSVVCGEGVAYVAVDGVAVRVPPREAEWRAPPLDELIGRIVEGSGAQVVITWGCDLPHAIDVSLLAQIAFPDVRPDLVSLAFSLGLSSTDPPPFLAFKVAIASVDVLRRANVDWFRLPAGAREGRLLILFPEQAPVHVKGEGVTVTDRPVASSGLWRPFKVNYEAALRTASDYTVASSLMALMVRGGDPLRVHRNKHLLFHGEQLWAAISSSLEANEESPAGGEQVEPWDLGCIKGGPPKDVAFDCLRPVGECLSGRPPPDELSILDSLGIRCGSPPSLDHEGMKGRVRTIVADLVGPKALTVAVRAARSLAARRGRLLVIASTKILLSTLSRHVEAVGDPLSWFMEGGPYLAYLDDVYGRPELLWAADEVLLLFPERYRGFADSGSMGLNEVISVVAERAMRLGASVITRAWSPTDPIAEPERLPEDTAGEQDQADVKLDVDDLMNYAREVFNAHWGRGARLRPYQEEALRVLFSMVASGRPSLEVVILPTGAGKSAIFQVASVVMADLGLGSSSIVISPLRALIHDQVRGARSRGLWASYVDSTVPESRRREEVEKALRGLIDLLYITPESASQGASERVLSEGAPALVVLDEAHALSRWGLSFRPSYLRLAEKLRSIEASRRPPIVALTASAPEDVVNDVMNALGFRDYDEYQVSLTSRRLEGVRYQGRPIVLRAPAVRPEIEVEVVPAPAGHERLALLANIVGQLSSWASSTREPWVGIVFVPFVESRGSPWLNVDYVADYLSARLGVEVARYHGKMDDRVRHEVEEVVLRASRGEPGYPNIVVATKAFGMGVDIPNIRWTVHLVPSESVEDLYQEIGRAGRDGKPARSIILYNPADVKTRAAMLAKEAIRPSQVYVALRALEAASSAFPSGSPVAVPLSEGHQGPITIRALDVLRLSGLVDYDVVEGPLALVREGCERVEGLRLRLRKGGCLVRGIRGVAYLCITDHGAAVVDSPSCDSSLPYSGHVALVYPEEGAFDDDLLPPEAFMLALWMLRREVKKVMDVKDLIEQTLAVKSRAGPSTASEAFKGFIEVKLRRGYELPKAVPYLGNVVRCESLSECLGKSASMVHDLVQNVGDRSVTVTGSEVALGRFVEAYVRRYGRAPPASRGAILKVRRYAREGRLEKLMDMGYLVIISKESRSIDELLKALDAYPYYVAYVYKGGGRVGGRG